MRVNKECKTNHRATEDPMIDKFGVGPVYVMIKN